MAKNSLAKSIVSAVVKKIFQDCETEVHEIVGDVERDTAERRAKAIRHRNDQIARGNEAIRAAVSHTAQGVKLIREQRNGDDVRNLVLDSQESELRHRLKRDLTHVQSDTDDQTADEAIDATVASTRMIASFLVANK